MPKSLNKELLPIAYLESSYGKNINHKPDARGEDWTAVGALGIKPVTAHDTIKNDATIKAIYSGLSVKEVGIKLRNDPNFYILICNAHWNYLRRKTTSLVEAVYAWRWGLTASNLTPRETICEDVYVKKYITMKVISRV